jgi:hypothetical protein
MVTAAWAYFVFDLSIIEELIAAPTSGDLNLTEELFYLDFIETVHCFTPYILTIHIDIIQPRLELSREKKEKKEKNFL